MLTTKLAEILDVRAGQMVTVEILEGARSVHSIPVVGLADELIGISAYMDASALNRLATLMDVTPNQLIEIDVEQGVTIVDRYYVRCLPSDFPAIQFTR